MTTFFKRILLFGVLEYLLFERILFLKIQICSEYEHEIIPEIPTNITCICFFLSKAANLHSIWLHAAAIWLAWVWWLIFQPNGCIFSQPTLRGVGARGGPCGRSLAPWSGRSPSRGPGPRWPGLFISKCTTLKSESAVYTRSLGFSGPEVTILA